MRPDWSKTGIGFFLSQKHCECISSLPECCESGWKITLAGSRFLKPAETRYAPINGEALAIAWSLQQTKYFTQGCSNLLVVTDHKPLVKLFSDRMLDEISNPRQFSLHQRMLQWKFDIEYMPGKDNYFSDGTSRNPINSCDDDISSEMLEGLRIAEAVDDDMESAVSNICSSNIEQIRAITWDMVKEETKNDYHLSRLIIMILSEFPNSKQEMTPNLNSTRN